MSFWMIVITKFLIWMVFLFLLHTRFIITKKRFLPQSKFSMWEIFLKLNNWFDFWIVFVTNNAFYDKSLSFGCKQSFEFNLLDFITNLFFSVATNVPCLQRPRWKNRRQRQVQKLQRQENQKGIESSRNARW